MAQRPVVPQFGNWDREDNVPYTVYFEKARKGRNGGKMINPNDPMQNPGMFPSAQVTPSAARNAPKEPIGRKAVRPKTLDIQSNNENGDRMTSTEGPRRNDNVSRQSGTGSTNQNRGGNGSGSGRPRRQNAGSEHRVDHQAPLHPQYQAKLIGKGSGSSWESKHSNDSSHGTSGRSGMKPISTGVESPDKGAAVPRFGEWDENNPSSADNFTQKFNKVRQERNSSSTPVSSTSTGPAAQAYANRRKQIDYNTTKHSWSSCFPCLGKSGART